MLVKHLGELARTPICPYSGRFFEGGGGGEKKNDDKKKMIIKHQVKGKFFTLTLQDMTQGQGS